MEKLDINRINAKAPYRVTFDAATNLYKFASTYNVSFSVGFFFSCHKLFTTKKTMKIMRH